eukprot:1152084-Pelagomonas_calceolata.AAC.6
MAVVNNCHVVNTGFAQGHQKAGPADMVAAFDNCHGFRKVIKKHDKLTSSSLKETYWPLIEERYPEHKKDVLHHHIDRLVDLYSILYENGDVAAANESLSQNLRQHIKVMRACERHLLGPQSPQKKDCLFAGQTDGLHGINNSNRSCAVMFATEKGTSDSEICCSRSTHKWAYRQAGMPSQNCDDKHTQQTRRAP